MGVEISFRSLRSVAELDRCLDLQLEIWGDDPLGCVAPMMLKVLQEVGGVVAGAFADADELVGFVCGVSGFRHGRPAHWSHMLGVKASHRDFGLGSRLKWLQRELVLEHQVETMYWTFDPLEGRNAHLNFVRLGVVVDEYRRDFYSGLSRSHRYADIGTDRLVVAWRLRGSRVTRAQAGAASEPVQRFRATAIVNVEAQDGEPARPIELSQALEQERVRIEIPAKIQDLKEAAPQLGAAWRRSTRRAFESYLAAGFGVDSFYRDSDTGRCFYCLRSNFQPT